jgi:hypothetical protein
VELESEGVSGVVGIVADEAMVAVEYKHTEEGDGVLEGISRGATFVQICWSAWRS